VVGVVRVKSLLQQLDTSEMDHICVFQQFLPGGTTYTIAFENIERLPRPIVVVVVLVLVLVLVGGPCTR
jgi:hypothetical protein